MSDRMMSVAEAREWLDPSTGPKPEVPSPLLVDRYARTIVAQAEQVERLQAAMRVTLPYLAGGGRSIETYYDLLPGDMEAEE